jgi:hypothetical protein
MRARTPGRLSALALYSGKPSSKSSRTAGPDNSLSASLPGSRRLNRAFSGCARLSYLGLMGVLHEFRFLKSCDLLRFLRTVFKSFETAASCRTENDTHILDQVALKIT